jgi:hypothetical protein
VSLKALNHKQNFIYLVSHRYISFALSTYAFSSYFNISVYTKRDDFYFPIINFPFLNGDVPLTSLYVAYIPRLVRFQRICNNVSDFHDDFLVVLWQETAFINYRKLSQICITLMQVLYIHTILYARYMMLVKYIFSSDN